MAKNQTRTSSKGACDKIYKAIRRVSDCPRSSKPLTAPGSQPLSPELKKTTTEPISTEFSVHFNHPVSATPTQQKEQTAKTHIASRTESLSPVIVPKVAFKTEQVKPRAERAASAQEGSDDKFSSYLDRAGAKIRTTSNVGGGGGDGGPDDGGRSVSRRDSFNDKINHLINRAKIKFRTTSSVGGGGRSVSRRDSFNDGGGRSVSRRDSFNDKISHFVNRAKIKFRTTSSVGGGGRSVSFK